MASPVHSPVQASLIFSYGGASETPSSPHKSSVESVTPRGNTKPRKNQPNTVPNLQANTDSDPSL